MIVYITGRWQFINKPNYQGVVIYAFWHGKLIMMPFLAPPGSKMNVITSGHRDGLLISKVMLHFKFNTIFVSRTATAFKGLKSILTKLKNGESIAITPDGSRGPVYQINSNIVEIAAMTGVPIIPISYGAKYSKILNTWDKFNLPYPFSKGVLVYGDPIFIPKHCSTEEIAEYKISLQNALNTITERAEQWVY
jgi:lysophospholipid acyltransferase (LPLAT)-like uncharacterized protein